MTILDRIVADKQAEVVRARRSMPEAELRARIADTPWSARGFANRLLRAGPGGVNVIAEVKRASPSKGDICKDLDAVECARQYETGGAAAVSVLTDAPYFKGSLEDLRGVRAAITLPVLRKEFIIAPYQVFESRAAGADAVLLIARILSPARLKELLDLSRQLGMDALVEIHSPQDYASARAAGSRLIGINNRNLATFATDLKTAMDLAAMLQPEEVPVAASGISRRSDVERNLQSGIFNFLVGESLVRAHDRAGFLQGLIYGDSLIR
ncbi:MAG: indole-3-glycerol phosphate synthase TrpC [Desulfobacteraceae bacterium]|nr:MAG: indole-3-glycerol phosphate synthase TrpC [Desulfobacteraceae bacterium]